MAVTPSEALRLTSLLAKKIETRRAAVSLAVNYFKGEEGRLRFASDEFREYFARRYKGFSDNWCMPVAQAPVERIRFRGLRLDGSEAADAATARAWDRNDGDRGLTEALLMMTVSGRSFGLVSPSPAGARLTFEHPDSAAVVYDAVTRERRAGLVVWADDQYEYGQLHLPGSVLKVRREKVALDRGERVLAATADWEFDTDHGAVEERNPLGAVALVEFRNQSLLDNDPISDIAQVMSMQDAINLVWAYQLNSLDYSSLPGRVIMNGEHPVEDVLDDDGNVIGQRPAELDSLIRDRVAWLEGQGISIGEWTPANLDQNAKVIEQAISHIAAQTRTPAHYLLGASDNTPAAGYELSEAGLVSKTSERIGFATPAVRELNRLMALADGDPVRAVAIAESKVLFAKPQYRSETQLMDGLLKMRQTGFPFQWIAEEYGLSPDDVKRVVQMARDEATDPYLQVKGAFDGAAADASSDSE